MAHRGLCSRREAEVYIENGWVTVDGNVIDQQGVKVEEDAKVILDDRAKTAQGDKVTILLNKPIGYVSNLPEKGYRPAVDLITSENQDSQFKGARLRADHMKKLAVAGRLDIDSTGLLVFTQDGTIAKQLIGENSNIEKEYLVRVEGNLTEEGMRLLKHGMFLDGVELKPAKVEWINEDQLRFILKQGRKRQVRRMCEMVELKVTGLKRVRTGRVCLGKLLPGQWRYLRKDESF